MKSLALSSCLCANGDKDNSLKKPAIFNLVILLTLLVACGAACPRRLWQPFPAPPPAAFKAEPTLEEVIQVVNANRARITGVYSTNSQIRGSGFPSLRTRLAVGSERNVRMRAGTGVPGSPIAAEVHM